MTFHEKQPGESFDVVDTPVTQVQMERLLQRVDHFAQQMMQEAAEQRARVSAVETEVAAVFDRVKELEIVTAVRGQQARAAAKTEVGVEDLSPADLFAALRDATGSTFARTDEKFNTVFDLLDDLIERVTDIEAEFAEEEDEDEEEVEFEQADFSFVTAAVAASDTPAEAIVSVMETMVANVRSAVENGAISEQVGDLLIGHFIGARVLTEAEVMTIASGNMDAVDSTNAFYRGEVDAIEVDWDEPGDVVMVLLTMFMAEVERIKTKFNV